MQNEQEVNQAIDQYGDMVRRICLLHLKNISDAEDIFQEVFSNTRFAPFHSKATPMKKPGLSAWPLTPVKTCGKAFSAAGRYP